MRREYEMTEADERDLLAAMQPIPYIVMGGMPPTDPQQRANTAWAVLGQRMGFAHMTVRPISGKGQRWFSAEPAGGEEGR